MGKSQWFVDEEKKAVVYANSEEKIEKAEKAGYKKINEEYAIYLMDTHYVYESL